MPELPEVETVRRQLAKEVIDKRIINVTYDAPKMLRPSATEFVDWAKGQRVVSYDRRAKQIFINLESGGAIAVHLKLNGRLLYRTDTGTRDGYVHIVLHFDDDTQLRFADSRKFGFFEKLENQGLKRSIIDKYGPEPLDDLDLGKFRSVIGGTRRKIKDVLMDQSLIAGIGNIYANDALWMAGIHPEESSSKLTQEDSRRLYDSLESVLREALADGGASDQWYRQLHGEVGNYQNHFKVYGKKGKSCSRHPGTMIEYLRVGQRGTYVCPRCQVRN